MFPRNEMEKNTISATKKVMCEKVTPSSRAHFNCSLKDWIFANLAAEYK